MNNNIAHPTLEQSNLAPNAQKLLCKRYYAKNVDYLEHCDHCGAEHEPHENFLKRVSFDFPLYEAEIRAGRMLPNSPTLFNLGVPGFGTLSACFFLELQDSLLDDADNIMEIGRTAAAITKFGGGVGYYFGNLRAKGALVNSTHGEAMGPVEVMRYMHAVGRMITQSGKRAAAQMGVLNVDHLDILEFINCKNERPDDLSTFNISVSVTDKFMRDAFTEGSFEEWLLHMMAMSCWQTGDPGIIFSDRVNRDNATPWLGNIKGCNPCSEQFLHHNESCNLASLNLVAFYDQETRTLDWAGIRRTVAIMVRYLNDVIDKNCYPTEEIDKASKYSRRIGVGFMGLADVLSAMNINYDTYIARDLAAEIMRVIRDQADITTVHLGRVLGTAPCYEGRGITRRNSIVTSVQPTGTTALLLGVSTGIEPLFALNNTRTTAEGYVLDERPFSLKMLADRGDNFTPKVASEIAPMDHLKMVSAVQVYVDNGISKTINVDNDATVDEIVEIYKQAWIQGMKAVSVFRDGCRDKQVLSKCGDEVCSLGDMPTELEVEDTASKQAALDEAIESAMVNTGQSVQTVTTEPVHTIQPNITVTIGGRTLEDVIRATQEAARIGR